LQDAEKEYPAEWIEDAIRIAVVKNVRTGVMLMQFYAHGKRRVVMEPIGKPLKRIVKGIVRESMPTSSTTDDSDTPAEVCPICGGVGYLRRDLPIDDPNFGKLVPCICRQNQTNLAARYRLYELSNLEAFKTMSFASFSVQGRLGLADEQIRSLQYALSQAQQFAGKPRGWLLLMGSYGCGKTHLAARSPIPVWNLVCRPSF